MAWGRRPAAVTAGDTLADAAADAPAARPVGHVGRTTAPRKIRHKIGRATGSKSLAMTRRSKLCGEPAHCTATAAATL